MGKSRVIDLDFGWARVNKNLAEFARYTILVGLPEDGAKPVDGGLTLAQIGALHEFGSDAANIPERKWLRSAIDHFRRPILGRFTKLWKAIMAGRKVDVDQGMNRIGMFGVARIREYIRKIGPATWEPLSPVTIRQKKSDRPLLDTGQLINGITYVLTKKRARRRV